MNVLSKMLVVIILITILSFFIVARDTDDYLYVKIEKENLREDPNGSIIGKVYKCTKMKVLEEKGNWVKVCITGWIWKPSTTNNKSEIAKLGADRGRIDEKKKEGVKSGQYVELVNYLVEALPVDFTRDSKPYGAHVRAYFQFRNKTQKTITGLIYKVKFIDSFGDILYETTLKDLIKLNPGEINPMSRFWYWEDNEFIDNEPYDKLHSAAEEGTIKIQVTILKIAFKDGTILECGE